MIAPSLAQAKRLLLAASCLLSLSGCAWTLITAADATGSVIQAGYAIASNYSSPTFVNGRPAKIRTVCIEVNQLVVCVKRIASYSAWRGRA
jgi:hypothetical protein